MKKKKTIFLIIGIIAVLALVIGLTYAFFQTNEEGGTNIIEVADGLSLELINEEKVSISDTMPMTDEYAIENQESYKFSLSNYGTQAYEYTISMKHEVVELPVSVIRCAIKKETDEEWTIGSLESFAYTNVINKSREENFELKLWVDKNTTNDYQGKEYTGHIEVTGVVTEGIGTGELTIDLTEGMVPIKWNGSTWVKADSTNINNDWYNYDEFKWANMALVNDESLYSVDVNEEIPMTNILAMYVWIPRYRYKLFNANNGSVVEQEIEVIFEEVDIPKSTGTTNGEYLTHPAFTFGSDELNGIWVGKFETSANTDSDCYKTPSEANCSNKISSISPRIVPNVDSLRNTNIAGLFSVNSKFKKESIYGITETNIDAHMMKNMEWGAVANLSHSKYGKYGNSSYTGANKEIYINRYRLGDNANRIITGCSSGEPGNNSSTVTTCAYTYEKENTGTGASTTGTIYGIYDMSGGATDYVMGNMATSTGSFNAGSSGFTTPYPESKYYDSYAYDESSDITHGRGLLGDATKESLKTFGSLSGGWYSDYAAFLNSSGAWFTRGGGAGGVAHAGLFHFHYSSGSANTTGASRSVLVNIN